MSETRTSIEDIAERCDCVAGWHPKPGHTAAEILAAIRARFESSPRTAELAARVERKRAELAAKGGA
jgi:hypothetical protein